jgi:hypothetical protein
MAQVTIMPQTGAATTGTGVFLGSAVTTANIQCTPQANVGFSGTVLIEASSATSPGNNDWATVTTLTFTNHTNVLNFDMFFTNKPWLRARLPANGTLGAVSVYLVY